MAQQSSVTFETIRNFPALSLNAVQAGVLRSAIIITAASKTLGGVDTGLLNNSKQYVTGFGKEGGLNDSSGSQASKLNISLKDNEAAYGATANYAMPQEFGTRKARPQPFARPAVAIATGSKQSEIARAINKEMERGALVAGQSRETFR